jgi:hypothetical protein
MVIVVYVLPGIYAVVFSLALAPRIQFAESIAIRRATWGLLFGALYGILIFAAPLAFESWRIYSHRPIDRWDVRNFQVLLAMVLCYSIISGLIGGVSAGTFALLARWATRARVP